MKKYKYSRKEWLEYYEDLEHMHITKEAKEDLLAKESNEEYSQRIMMEQVPKQEDNKECRCERCGKKYSVPITYKYASCICKDCIIQISPSPLDDIEEIEVFEAKEIVIKGIDSTVKTLCKLVGTCASNQNKLIRNQNLIIKQLKQK